MYEKLWEFFIDGKHKFSKKFLMTCLGIIALLSIDYFFRFSDSYIAEKKIEQIGKIQELIKQDSLRIETKVELLRIEKDVLRRQGFWSFSSDLISLIQRTISSPKQNTAKPIAASPILKDVNDEITPKRNVVMHILSSCWIFILIMVVLPIAPFYDDRDKKVTLSNVLITEVFLVIVSVGYSYLLALIPVLEYPLINYIINISSLPIIFIVIGLIVNKKRLESSKET